MTPLLTLNIARNELLAMQKLASHDTARFILNGVHFEVVNRAVLMVASNGVLLGVLKTGPHIGGELKEFTADVSPVKMFKSSTKPIAIEVFETEVSFNLNGVRVVSERITEGVFPNWKNAVPKEPFCDGRYNFNVCLVNKLFRVAALLNPQSVGGVTMLAHADTDGKFSELSPYSIFFPACDRFYGLLMPMRASEQTVPDWVK